MRSEPSSPSAGTASQAADDEQLAQLVGAVLRWGELRNFADLLQRAEPGWLLIAAALQASTCLSVASGWRAVLQRAEGKRYGVRPLVRIALSKLFVDQALPTAGIGGNVLLVDQLMALGVTRGTAVAALLISLLGFYASYLLFALLALFPLWLHGEATPLMAGLVTTFVLVAVAIPSLALWMRGRGGAPLPPAIAKVRPIRQLLLRVMVFNALVFAADILTLYASLQGLSRTRPRGSGAASAVVRGSPR